MIIYDESLRKQIKMNFERMGRIATKESIDAHIQYMAGHIYGIFNYSYQLNVEAIKNIYKLSTEEKSTVKIVNDIHEQHVGTPQGLMKVWHFDVITSNDKIKHHIYLVYQPLITQPYPYYVSVDKM
jgi:hypothetical protein